MKNEKVICTVSLALVKPATSYALWRLEFRFRVLINLSLHFCGRGCLLRVPVKYAVFDPGANFVQILRPA